MVHDSSAWLDDDRNTIIKGDMNSNSVVHGILLTNNVKVVIRSIHAHGLDWLLHDSIDIVECCEYWVDLWRVSVDEHLGLLWDVSLDYSSLLIKHTCKLILTNP